MKKKKRDSAYWLGRLEREHPDIYADYHAGRISSVRAACIEAGLIRASSRLDALKRDWKRASLDERYYFLEWVAGTGYPVTARPLGAITKWTDEDGRLSEEALCRVDVAMKLSGNFGRLGYTTGPVMKAMGYKTSDPRLGQALARNWRPTSEFVVRLSVWLNDAEG